MSNLTPSDKYSIVAVVALIAMVIVNSAVVMLVLSLVGLIAGFWLLRSGEVRRGAFVAFAAFALAGVFAVIGLVRGS